MWTIGKLAKRFAVSRSTLLYYDRIGLLSPSLRSGSNYRLYAESDVRRMERIAMLKEAGLPLETIHALCDAPGTALEQELEAQLGRINREIAQRRAQQQLIVRLLKEKEVLAATRLMDKERWVALLEGAGMDDSAKCLWHGLFEQTAPEAHQDFLESLGIDAEEIALIRARSREWSALSGK
ncbi:MAG: MerR family transcriptional regulator [Magnetococcales bacterium]|nr:MerR family transcriptional regulator [Magnetococcales bacterium]